MNRLINAIKSDVIFQWKQGFYVIYGIITLIYLVLLSLLPTAFKTLILPMVLFSDPSVLGLFFIGGIILLEKEQGVSMLLRVTPLKVQEFITSKILSLTFLALLVSSILVISLQIDNVNWVYLILGISLTSSLFTLYGILIALRCESLNAFFVKMIPYMLIAILPCGLYFTKIALPLLALYPPIGGFMIVFGAFNGLKMIELFAALTGLIIANGLFFRKAVRDYSTKILPK